MLARAAAVVGPVEVAAAGEAPVAPDSVTPAVSRGGGLQRVRRTSQNPDGLAGWMDDG